MLISVITCHRISTENKSWQMTVSIWLSSAISSSKSWQDRWNFLISKKNHPQSRSRQILYGNYPFFECHKLQKEKENHRLTISETPLLISSLFILWRWEFKEIFCLIEKPLFCVWKELFYSRDERQKNNVKSNGPWIVSVHDVCLSLNL